VRQSAFLGKFDVFDCGAMRKSKERQHDFAMAVGTRPTILAMIVRSGVFVVTKASVSAIPTLTFVPRGRRA
jgi:hypothetical protein